MKKQTLILNMAVALAAMVACQSQSSKDQVSQVETDSVAIVSVGHLENPDSALVELKAGNARYVAGKSTAFKALSNQRTASAAKQTPFAIVVSCSDSRVPAEEVFDQGVGELFVIRTAGEVLDKAALGSIEYAAEHLGVKLIVVLGHERCGAVTAAVQGGEAPGAIGYIVEQIKPAVDAAKAKEGDLLYNSIQENVALVQKQLATSEPILKELVKKGDLKIIGAYYDLDEGTVAF